MRIPARGQITIPKPLRDWFEMRHGVEVEITPTHGLLIRRRATAEHPVERVYSVLGRGRNTDEFIKEIRGR